MAEKNATVKVVLHAPGSNPPFKFESDDLPIDENNVIYFSNCGKFKGFMVNYDLDNSANPGFLFPTVTTDALWVTESGPCPTQACTWDVFEAKKVENGGKRLVVKNTNPTVQDFAYTLRVKNGATWLPLDPGGANQNGGIPLFQSSLASMVTGGIVGMTTLALASNAFDASAGLVYAVGGAIVGLIIGLLFDRM